MPSAVFRCSRCGLEVDFQPRLVKGRDPDDLELRQQMRKAHGWLFTGYLWPPKAKAYCSKGCAEPKPVAEPTPTAPARREREEQGGLGL